MFLSLTLGSFLGLEAGQLITGFSGLRGVAQRHGVKEKKSKKLLITLPFFHTRFLKSGVFLTLRAPDYTAHLPKAGLYVVHLCISNT